MAFPSPLLHAVSFALVLAAAAAELPAVTNAAPAQAIKVLQVRWQRQQASYKPRRICLGDRIRFNWTGSHSVWLASKAAPCKPTKRLTQAGIKSYTFTAKTLGTYYFMCGNNNAEHCTSGNMRMTVTVAQCNPNIQPSPSPSLSPSPYPSPSPSPLPQVRAQLLDDAYTVSWNHEMYVHDSAGVLRNDILDQSCTVNASLALGPYPTEDATPNDGSGWPLLAMEPNGAFKIAKMGFAGVKTFYYQVTDCNGNLGEPPYAKVTITFEPDPTVTWSNPDSYKTAFRTILKVPGAGSNLGLFVNDKPPADCSSGGLAQSFRLDRLVGGTFLDYQEVGGDFIGDMWEVDATRQGNNSATAGKVVAYQDGSFLFVPAKDFVGMATFQYTVMDTCNFMVSNPGTVVVEVLPPPDQANLYNDTSPGTIDANSPIGQQCDGKTFLPGTEQPDGSGTYCYITPNGTVELGTGKMGLGLSAGKILQITRKCSVGWSLVQTLYEVITDPNVAKNDWSTWLQVLASGPTSPVCCIGSILPTLFEALFLGYADAVNDYPSLSRSMASAGNTILLMYMHSGVPVPDLEKVVLHYGHVMPPTIFDVGCMTLGYHIYCPENKISPDLLLHELVHVGQFVNSAGRSVAQFGRIYLQQYCDAGYYEGIAWEREAYEKQKVLDTAPEYKGASDAGCRPNPGAWMTYTSNFSRCVRHTTASMADGALACACKNHQPFSGPFDPVCSWLDGFSRNCNQCALVGRRLHEQQAPATYTVLEEDGGRLKTRKIQSLIGGLPLGSPCKGYDPKRVCAAAPETQSTATLYGRYTMGVWHACREAWKQQLRSGTSADLADAVCGCGLYDDKPSV